MAALSRRTLLKLIGATGALASLGSTAACGAGEEGDEDSSADAVTQGKFDFIVIGSGAGGGPVACRLAEAGYTVCIIEAGGDRGASLKYQVPAFHPNSTEEPSMQWDYFVDHYSNAAQAKADPKHSVDAKGNTARTGVFYPRSGTLGGCTAHNAMITIRPQDADWKQIADLTGDASWAPEKMKTYFARFEDCQYAPADAVHGNAKGSWLATSKQKVDAIDGHLVFDQVKDLGTVGQHTIANILYKAAVEAGDIKSAADPVGALRDLLSRDVNGDFVGRDAREGLFTVPLATKRGVRNSAREFILATQAKHKNLTVKLNTFVTRILFADKLVDGKPVATGVSAVQYPEGKQVYRASPLADGSAGQGLTLTASREVIVAGGAFNTPQILMLSGIGAQDHLKAMGIDGLRTAGGAVVHPGVNLPGVGGNLQDRYEVCVHGDQPESKDLELFTGCTFTPDAAKDPCFATWQSNHTGPYATNKCVGGVVKRSASAKKANGPADLFVFGLHSSFYGYYPGYTVGAVPPGFGAAGAPPPPLDKDGKPVPRARFSWVVLKAHSGNTAGTVRLRSANPFDVPVINFRYFEEGTPGAAQADLDAVAEGVEFARAIHKASGMVPAGQIKSVAETRDAVRKFVKDNAWGHHASCTCPMGPKNPQGKDADRYVLDSEFRVRGTKGLRVVDASIFPKIPGLFIVTAIYMASEKAADVIIRANPK